MVEKLEISFNATGKEILDEIIKQVEIGMQSLEFAEKEINRLKQRELDLLEANNRYLQRARYAEQKLVEASW